MVHLGVEGPLGDDAGRPCHIGERWAATVDGQAVAFLHAHRDAIGWAINAACVPQRHRDDVRQDVAVRIIRRFRNRGPLAPGGHASFAITVARNACIDFFRRTGRERPAADPAIYDRVPDDAPLPYERMDRLQGHERLHEAIASLTPLKRYVVRQVLAGRSLVDLAHELERSHGSLKTLHHRAVLDLRKRLQCR
ncbi:MAG: sigma-70 family RNA polymerase sigma factor [Bacteroidetes bacterium]|nr:sigma-70 family RNA polymerase sigma factor [Bacteroidota bacterium]